LLLQTNTKPALAQLARADVEYKVAKADPLYGSIAHGLPHVGMRAFYHGRTVSVESCTFISEMEAHPFRNFQ
jgi:hypothetical protein